MISSDLSVRTLIFFFQSLNDISAALLAKTLIKDYLDIIRMNAPERKNAPLRSPDRESGIELLRCIAMLMVLALHINYYSIGSPTLGDMQADPLNATTRAFLQCLCIGAVNVFVFISGWFGIRPKVEGLSKLVFQVFFFSFGAYFALLLLGIESFSISGIARALYFSSDGWFVKAYLALYLLSPLLNAFMAQGTRRQVEIFLVVYGIFEFFYGWVADTAAGFAGGYSALHFIFLYILARYIHVYHLQFLAGIPRNLFFTGFMLMVLVTTVIALPIPILEPINTHAILYSNPTVILMAFFLTLSFTRLRYKSSIVNTIAVSSFSVYLLHSSPAVMPYYEQLGKFLYANHSGISYLLLTVTLLFAIYLATLLIDQLRIVCWRSLWRLVSPRIPRSLDEALTHLPR